MKVHTETGESGAGGHRDQGKFVLRPSSAYLVLVTGGNAFGSLLRDTRMQADLSQAEAASRSDISQAYWGDIERGERDPNSVEFETLWRMIAAISDEQGRRLQLLELAGDKHRAIANSIYAAKLSSTQLPPLDVVIETTPELYSSEDRAALKRMAAVMKTQRRPEVAAEGDEEAG